MFYHRNIYDLDGTNTVFISAIKDNVRHHRNQCLEYAAILARQGFSEDSLITSDDLYRIPPIPTLFLKNHTLSSSPKEKLMLKSTTSGTSGKVSEMGLDWQSSLNGLGMILGTFLTHRLLSPCPTNHIVLGYQPSARNKMGAVKTAYATTFAAFPIHREYALRDTGKDYVLNLHGIMDALVRYERSGLPVRFMGFPAYFSILLKELLDSGIKLKLHAKSMVMLAGGWKQFLSEMVDKPTLYSMCREALGIDEHRIKEFFGAVEHPIAYCDCPNHHFHVPVYSRVIIRDTQLVPVGFGQPGLLNLITPMMTSMPFTSVITDDLAVLYPGERCGCGIKAPYFEILGRVGLSDIKTCAAGASELLSAVGRVGTT
ncbi:MAG: acyl-protein synthetase [Eubacteriales bacterium]